MDKVSRQELPALGRDVLGSVADISAFLEKHPELDELALEEWGQRFTAWVQVYGRQAQGALPISPAINCTVSKALERELEHAGLIAPRQRDYERKAAQLQQVAQGYQQDVGDLYQYKRWLEAHPELNHEFANLQGDAARLRFAATKYLEFLNEKRSTR